MEKQSLTRKTIRATILGSIVFGLTALFIGLSIYGSGLINQYVTRAFETARQASDSATMGADSVALSRQVMEIYRSLTPEQRQAEDYLDHYSGIDTRLQSGSDYDVLYHMIRGYIIEVDDVYIGMYDLDTRALVYVVDPDWNEEERLQLGQWEDVSERECRKFLNWDGEGMLYDISNTREYGWMCTAGYPIRDENGEICEFILADVTMESISGDLRAYALKITVAMVAATAIIAWFVARRMKRTVADPINEIAGAARAYVEDKNRGVERSHFADLGIRTGDEIENLTEIMAGMERDLALREERITRITAEKERINTELDMARKIQTGMLPGVFPAFPDRKEFDLYATMTPAREVGGDFYDFYLVDDDHLFLAIADVSGKGIPAALFMMVTKALLKSAAMAGAGPAEILRNTNEAICSNNRMQMFVTAWVGILEISTGKLTAANAGHEYPAVMKDRRFDLYKEKHGLVIGGMEGVTYREYEIRLEKGDKLFVYTDGVPEATDAEEKLFGTERMLDALNLYADEDPEAVLSGVRRAVDAFVGETEQFDDITMLCLEYRGNAEER